MLLLPARRVDALLLLLPRLMALGTRMLGRSFAVSAGRVGYATRAATVGGSRAAATRWSATTTAATTRSVYAQRANLTAEGRRQAAQRSPIHSVADDVLRDVARDILTSAFQNGDLSENAFTDPDRAALSTNLGRFAVHTNNDLNDDEFAHLHTHWCEHSPMEAIPQSRAHLENCATCRPAYATVTTNTGVVWNPLEFRDETEVVGRAPRRPPNVMLQHF